MNVAINKDISKIHETMLFGLPMRETILAGVTIVIAVVAHKALYEYIISDSLLNIVTALCATPTGFLTFYTYQGMKGEQVIAEYFQSAFLSEMVLTGENDFSESIKEIKLTREKEGLRNDKIDQKEKRRKKRKISRSEKSAGHDPVQSDI